MAFKKQGVGDKQHYENDSGYWTWNKVEDISLEHLNDTKRRFSMEENGYVREYIAYTEDDRLPSGMYKVSSDMYGATLLTPIEKPKQLKLFEIGAVTEVLKEFDDFKNGEDFSEVFGGMNKRGVLLYGPPGTGKTSAINMIINSVDDEDVLILYVDTTISESCLKALKRDDRLKLLIFEELTQTLASQSVGKFLRFLDGEDSLNNCFVIATTNYPEALPGNLVDRPGRFDRLIKVEEITAADKKKYLEHFLQKGVTKADLKLVQDFSMSYLKELILVVKRTKLSIREAVKKLEEQKSTARANFAEPSSTIGFENDDFDD